MISLVPFEPGHVVGVRVQRGRPEHQMFLGMLDRLDGLFTWSAIEGGVLLGVGGFVFSTRVYAWAILTDIVKPRHFIALHRLALHQLDHMRCPIEAHINPAFPQGLRWAELLGFRRAGTTQMLNGAEYETVIFNA